MRSLDESPLQTTSKNAAPLGKSESPPIEPRIGDGVVDHHDLVTPLEESMLDEAGQMLGRVATDAAAVAAASGAAAGAPDAASLDDVLTELFGAPAEPVAASGAAPETSEVPGVVDALPSAESLPVEAPTAVAPAPIIAAASAATGSPAGAPSDQPAPPANAAVTTVEATPVVVPVAPGRRNIFLRILDATILPPLARLSKPVSSIPASARMIVGLLGLTLLPWVPAIWWLGGQVVAADRVRALNSEELATLVSLGRENSPGSKDDGHGEKKAEKKPDADKKPETKPETKPEKKPEKPAKSGGDHAAH